MQGKRYNTHYCCNGLPMRSGSLTVTASAEEQQSAIDVQPTTEAIDYGAL
jgi:hypothetical protein